VEKHSLYTNKFTRLFTCLFSWYWLLIMVDGVGGVGGDFTSVRPYLGCQSNSTSVDLRECNWQKSGLRKTHEVRKIKVRILPTGPHLRSATFGSSVYAFAGLQVRILPMPITLHSNYLAVPLHPLHQHFQFIGRKIWLTFFYFRHSYNRI